MIERTKEWFYMAQLRRYLVQYMCIFADLKVRVGASDKAPARLIDIPIFYGSKDKVVASIKSEGTTNKPIRLPTMSCRISGLDMADDLRKGVGVERRTTYMPTGGVFPDSISVVHQLMPVPYKANIELAIFVSNTDQHFQIMEQILVLFDPILQIQSSDEVFDMAKITTVKLEGITFDENYPVGNDRRLIQSTLTFSMPVYLSIPANVKQDYVANIKLRIADHASLNIDGEINYNVDINYETVAELDAAGIQYGDLFTLSDIQGIK